jgi:hypothetical protein
VGSSQHSDVCTDQGTPLPDALQRCHLLVMEAGDARPEP